MTYIPRNAESRLKHFANGYPVLVVRGPHQSGTPTLVRHAFPEHRYVSLEDLDQREFAKTDPRGFLHQFTEGAILDEARCPGPGGGPDPGVGGWPGGSMKQGHAR